MKISETHKNFPDGSKGRLTIRDDEDNVLAVIFTPVQKARRYCESNPETPQGIEFARVMTPAVEEEPAVVAVPLPPVLSGSNPLNTALMSAQRKLSRLHESALSADPMSALRSIRTSRGNKYLNTCDDYRCVLLAHFEGALA